jgi:hypothetical protein
LIIEKMAAAVWSALRSLGVAAAEAAHLVEFLRVLRAVKGERTGRRHFAGRCQNERLDIGPDDAAEVAWSDGLENADSAAGPVIGLAIDAVAGARGNVLAGHLLSERQPSVLGGAVGEFAQAGGECHIERRLRARKQPQQHAVRGARRRGVGRAVGRRRRLHQIRRVAARDRIDGVEYRRMGDRQRAQLGGWRTQRGEAERGRVPVGHDVGAGLGECEQRRQCDAARLEIEFGHVGLPVVDESGVALCARWAGRVIF